MRWLASFDERKLWGCLFLSIGSVFFVGFFFVAVISKLLPPSHVPLISALQNDCYDVRAPRWDSWNSHQRPPEEIQKRASRLGNLPVTELEVVRSKMELTVQ
ncbi:hypothetical protein VIGAN_04091500 [Vigna angularis var. angularis]|uniref:Uncharacterized protein n=1 Tax=Vigna angularis var. angularis TaxID=157739 RepID=A0A0S3RSY6_PHAAN|nr:hypothetical protein VIGAN_04091500 [Vigna angularis var. angularis]